LIKFLFRIILIKKQAIYILKTAGGLLMVGAASQPRSAPPAFIGFAAGKPLPQKSHSLNPSVGACALGREEGGLSDICVPRRSQQAKTGHLFSVL
jgi:hypothetical protein